LDNAFSKFACAFRLLKITDATKEFVAHLFIRLVVTRKMQQLSFTSNKAVQGTNVHNGFQAKIIA